MFRHPAWAVGSYSGSPATAGTVASESTGGCYQGDVSPCRACLECGDEEGVPEEGDWEPLPGLDALEALAAAHVVEDVFGVVGEGEEHGEHPGEEDAVDEDRHGAGVGLLAGGQAEVREEDGGQPDPLPQNRLQINRTFWQCLMDFYPTYINESALQYIFDGDVEALLSGFCTFGM